MRRKDRKRELFVHAHFVPHLKPGDTIAELLDDTRRVATEHGGVFAHCKSELGDFPVDRVQARGMDLNKELAGFWLRDVNFANSKTALFLEEEESLLFDHCTNTAGVGEDKSSSGTRDPIYAKR